MKKIIFIALSFALSLPVFAQNSTPVQSQKDEWKVELAQFQDSLKDRSGGMLWALYAAYGSKMAGTCVASVAVTAAVFVTDTLPVTNVLAEGIGNMAAPDYQSYESILSVETLAGLGRGVIGGGGIALYESLEFVVLWLGDNEEHSWEALSKVYGSTIKTAESVFARKGQCVMSAAKLSLVANELNKRSSEKGKVDLPNIPPRNPIDSGVYNDESQPVIPSQRLP